MVVVVLRSPIHANEPSEYNGMLYRTSNRVLNNGIKVIILICMDGTSQYHHYPFFWPLHFSIKYANEQRWGDHDVILRQSARCPDMPWRGHMVTLNQPAHRPAPL